MLNAFSSQAALVLLTTTLSLVGIACTQDKQINVTHNQQPSGEAVSTPPTPVPPQPKPLPLPETQINAYELAVDRAAGAYSISQSAQSNADWNLVASEWQDAIKLLKSVSKNSPNFTNAQTKIVEYQRQLNYAKRQATRPPQVESAPPAVAFIPAPSPVPKTDLNPAPQPQIVVPSSPDLNQNQKQEVFEVPIKRRAGGTPVIDVTFNGAQQFEMIVDTGASGSVITQQMAAILGVVPVATAKANTASAKAVQFPIGYVDSMQAGGVVANNVSVAIAGSELDTGLLGHDFFGDYDVTIKRDVVEFRPR